MEWVSLVDQSGTLCGMGDTGGAISIIFTGKRERELAAF